MVYLAGVEGRSLAKKFRGAQVLIIALPLAGM